MRCALLLLLVLGSSGGGSPEAEKLAVWRSRHQAAFPPAAPQPAAADDIVGCGSDAPSIARGGGGGRSSIHGATATDEAHEEEADRSVHEEVNVDGGAADKQTKAKLLQTKQRCWIPGTRSRPVTRNLTTLGLIDHNQIDTGWLVQLDLSFTRDPPVYGDGDESIGVDFTIMELRNSGSAWHKPPLPVGRSVAASAYVNGIHSGGWELNSLQRVSDESTNLLTFYQFLLGTSWAFNENGERCHGLVTVLIDIDLSPYGRLSAEVTCVLEAPREDLLDVNWPVAPRSGRLGHCLSEMHYDYSCWRHIRQRLFGIPIFTTQTELVVSALVSSSFFGQDNTPEFRSKFPVEDSGRTQRFTTCAVVGSAGHLLSSSLGAHIDTHEMVLRFNEAPTVGFEIDVGSRTTHRILPGLGIPPYIRDFLAAQIPRREREELIFVPNVRLESRSKRVEDYLYWHQRFNGSGIHLISPAFVHHAWKAIRSRNSDTIPTTGFIGLMWSIEVCDHVHTYGMGFHRHLHDVRCSGQEGANGGADCKSRTKSIDRRSRYSYYQRLTSTQWPKYHKWEEEDRLHQAWHEEGVVRRHFDLEDDSDARAHTISHAL